MMTARKICFFTTVTILLLFTIGLGDTVETWDGRLYEGKIKAGIPDVLKVDDNGVAISVRRTATLEMSFIQDSEVVQLTTITGKAYEDRLLTSLGTVTIQTSSGETEIPTDQIRRITFPYKQTESPMYPNTAYLADGRTYDGRLTGVFPETISIEVDGITSNVRTNRIITLEFGEPAMIESTERVYEGKIISKLPEEIELETKYGSVAIKRRDMTHMTFTPNRAVPVAQATFGIGVGGKFLRSVPFVIGNLRVGRIDVEVGLGPSSLSVGGAAASALWYSISARYRFFPPSQGLSISPYLGAGGVGMTLRAPGASSSAVGVNLLGGISVNAAGLGVPIVLLGGLNYVLFGAMTVQVGGISVSVPIAISGLAWHVGLRWDF